MVAVSKANEADTADKPDKADKAVSQAVRWRRIRMKIESRNEEGIWF